MTADEHDKMQQLEATVKRLRGRIVEMKERITSAQQSVAIVQIILKTMRLETAELDQAMGHLRHAVQGQRTAPPRTRTREQAHRFLPPDKPESDLGDF